MKRLFILVCVLVVLVAAMSGCRREDSTASQTRANPANEDADGVITNGVFPLTQEKRTLSVLAPKQSNIEDIETNDFTVYYEGLTNVAIDWEIVPSEGYEEKVNISLQSGEYPDIYLACDLSASQQLVYGEQGVFLPLNDYFAQSEYLQLAMSAIPNLREMCTLPNGKIYSIPAYDENPHVIVQDKMWINQTWLDNLGLEMPTTTEAYLNTLVAFKERDANGNGDPNDEIPLATTSSGWNVDINQFLMKSFVYNDTNNVNLYLSDGMVKPAMVSDGYRAGLEYLALLYAEDLLYAQSFTQTGDQLRQLIEGGESNRIGGMPGGVPNGTNIGEENGRWLEYVAMPPLEGPEGLRQAASYPYVSFYTGKVVITTTSEYPDLAFMWANELFGTDPDTGYLMNQRVQYGLEGVTWEKAPQGMTDFSGEQAFYYTPLEWGALQNVAWRAYGPSLFSPTNGFDDLKYRYGLEGDETTNLEIRLYQMSMENYFPYMRDQNDCFPPLVFSEDQATVIGEKGTVISTYVDEMTARFITGDADLATEWDAYVDEVWNKGLQDIIDVYQAAYDASSFS